MRYLWVLISTEKSYTGPTGRIYVPHGFQGSVILERSNVEIVDND